MFKFIEKVRLNTQKNLKRQDNISKVLHLHNLYGQ